MAVFNNTDIREVITGGIENDTFQIVAGTVGAGNDVFDGAAGDDTAYGGNGDDRLTGGEGADLLVGGIGTNNISGGNDNDYIGTDRLTGTATGGEGLDSLDLSGVGDVDMLIDLSVSMIGGLSWSGFENIFASQGDDTMLGSANANYLNGGSGSDIVRGFAGNDILIAENIGERDDDRIYGGAGNDYIGTQGGRDRLFGGAGRDQLQINTTEDITLTLGARRRTVDLGDEGRLRVGGFEDVIGGTGNDALNGSGGANRLDGMDGEDTLTGRNEDDYLGGGNDDDTLFGGLGNDQLQGGNGADSLTGGDGADFFIYYALDESLVSSSDTINDFTLGIDKLALNQLRIAITGGTRVAEFTFLDGGAFTAGGDDELRFAGGKLQGDVTGDGVADFAVTLTGVATLSAGDLQL